MADSLAPLLRTLRVRAGNPSYRTIERLIATQHRKDNMRRATIQEKIVGKSSANLMQVLSIVEALSDYARSMGAPLADDEIDPRVWRERFSEVADRENLKSGQLGAPVSSAEEFRPQWVTRHLRSAGMHDVIDFVDSSQQRPVAEWLPEVIRSIKKAKMSLVEFLEPASRQSVPALVDTVSALNAGNGGPVGEPESPAVVLLHHAAINHPAESVPMIMVALRRADLEDYVPGFIVSVARVQSASDLLVVVDALRSASLSFDADEILAAVGGKRSRGDIIEVVDLLDFMGAREDANCVLEEIGSGGLGIILSFCRTIDPSREDRGEILNRIANGMDWSDPDRILKYFENAGEEGMVAIVRDEIEKFKQFRENARSE
ncbi:hypothetical protein [Streptomyces anulatus]|uniref:hypothetical protein n=1 Tax=Streptomyces anulatus TaxID=1892 RepID=UPI002ED2F350|nr:hypothetical protein OG703_20890 [Streptomyces anulatus]